MSLRTIILAILSTSFAVESVLASEWKIDFSRRFQPDEKAEFVVPPTQKEPARPQLVEMPAQFVKDVFLENDPAPEVVILNTEKGFVPSTVSLQEGQAYRFHVVNVNAERKNVSFVLDSFQQHHATYYGQIQTFVIRPEKSGIFRFSSPETAALGKMVVAPKSGGPIPMGPALAPATPVEEPAAPQPAVRVPASE